MRVGAELSQHHQVLTEVTLESQDADSHSRSAQRHLPATIGETVGGRDVGDVDSDHGLAQSA